MALQPITGYPSSWRAPFTAAEILFAQGPSNAPAGRRATIYVMPMTSAGAWTAGTVYEVKKEQDAIDGAGAGSPLHRAIRFHLKVNKGGKLYALPYAASSGTGNAVATATVTFSGTPTAAGQAIVTVCGEQCSVSFKTTDTATTMGDTLAALINAKTWLPLTAANNAGVVTLTAKIAGASQGTASVGVYRIHATVDPGKGATVATSGAALGSGTAGADGATAESANLDGALANIAAARFYYMGFSVWDATSIGKIKTRVATKSDPNPGLLCRAFCATVDTLANAQTLATGKNYERLHLAWQKNSEHDPAEIVAQVTALHQKCEELDTAFSGFDGYRGADWLLLPAYSEADWPDGDDINDAVTDGIMPIGSDQTGSFLAMSVNTRSKDATGALDDFRACETHRVSVMDDLADTLRGNHIRTFAGFKLRDDEYLSDGTVNHNQKLPPKVLTPSRYKPWFFNQLQAFADVGKIQRIDEWKDATRVNVDPQNVSRLEVGTSGRTIDILHQTTFRLAETTPG